MPLPGQIVSRGESPMNIRPITREEAAIRVLAEPDDIPVEGNACASGDDDFDREIEQSRRDKPA